MRRRKEAAFAPADSTIALMAAVSLILFAWGLGEMLRSLYEISSVGLAGGLTLEFPGDLRRRRRGL